MEATMMKLLTADEVHKMLGISLRGLYNLTSSNELPSVRIGRCIRYDPKDVEAFIDRNRTVQILDRRERAANG